MLASGSNDRQTKFWARNRLGSTAGLQDATDDKDEELQTAEIELGNHVGIVIGRRGATIISMQRATGTKMYVDQVRRVLLIQGTEKQIQNSTAIYDQTMAVMPSQNAQYRATTTRTPANIEKTAHPQTTNKTKSAGLQTW